MLDYIASNTAVNPAVYVNSDNDYPDGDTDSVFEYLPISGTLIDSRIKFCSATFLQADGLEKSRRTELDLRVLFTLSSDHRTHSQSC